MIENNDEDLIEDKNKILNSKILSGLLPSSIYNSKELDWWKEQFSLIIKFDDSIVVERIKIILGNDAWNKIKKELEESK